MDDKKGSFAKGALVGAVVGAVAGVLLAPKAGKETRADISKMAKKLKKDATGFYEDAVKMLNEKVEALRKAGKKIDETKYMAFVSEVVVELKKDKKVATEAAKGVGAQLKKDWAKVKAALEDSTTTTKSK